MVSSARANLPLPTSKKKYHSTPSPFEALFGFHRAVRRDNLIFVSGTTAVTPTSDGPPTLQYPGNAEMQTIAAFDEGLKAVEALGGVKQDVVRVRMFVNGRANCAAVGKGFTQVFGRGVQREGEGDVGVAASMIVVPGGFVEEGMLVEVELDAVVDS